MYKVGTRVIRVQTGQHYVISKIETKRADGSLFKKETRFHLKHERGPIDLIVSEDELKTLFSPIKQTNADWIRSMTDEKLAEFLFDFKKDFGRHPDFPKAREAAIQALNEVEEYRAIGTPEECRTAMEQKAKKVIEKYKAEAPVDIKAYGEDAVFGYCPVCGGLQSDVWNTKYCGDCGQKLDWSGENE